MKARVSCLSPGWQSPAVSQRSGGMKPCVYMSGHVVTSSSSWATHRVTSSAARLPHHCEMWQVQGRSRAGRACASGGLCNGHTVDKWRLIPGVVWPQLPMQGWCEKQGAGGALHLASPKLGATAGRDWGAREAFPARRTLPALCCDASPKGRARSPPWLLQVSKLISYWAMSDVLHKAGGDLCWCRGR